MIGRSVMVVLLVAASAATSAGARPRFGIEGGWYITELTREGFFLPLDTEYEPDWTVGAVVQQPLTGAIALVSGLCYARIHDDYLIRIISSGGPVIEEIRLDFKEIYELLEAPVRLEWRPRERGTLFGSVVFEGGVVAGYLLEAWSTAEVTVPAFPTDAAKVSSSSSGNSSTFREKVTGSYQRWNLSAELGGGLDIGLGSGVATLRLRYQHGFTNWIDADEAGRYTRTVQVVAGWRR